MRERLLAVALLCTATPEELLKEGEALCLIQDYQEACDRYQQAVTTYPDNKELQQQLIRALALAKNEQPMLKAWRQYQRDFPEDRENKQLIEDLAWGVVGAASKSAAPKIRLTSLLAAFFSQDMRGVHILEQHLGDKNNFLRQAAVSLSGNMRDYSLQRKMEYLLNNEKVWHVKMAAIQAVGQMKMKSAKERLLKIASDRRSSVEEQAASITSLVAMSDELESGHLYQLVNSPRYMLRLLGCRLVEKHGATELLKYIVPLIEDPHPNVRIHAMQAVARLNPLLGREAFQNKFKDPIAKVAITAAWGELLNGNREAEKLLNDWLIQGDHKVRCYTAALLSAAGTHGVPLLERVIHEHDDPYIRMNAAIGLIGQRHKVERASQALYSSMSQVAERIVWEEDDGVRVIKKSQLKHHPLIPQYPEAVNQMTRLELLNLLAIVNHPRAKEGIQHFVEGRGWGITGVTSALLLSDGDENSMKLVEQLLKHPESTIRLQAALVLSLWGRNVTAIQTLEEGYGQASRELKEKILEGLGRIGARRSIPFLLQCLEEPHQSLRVLASAALLQCLYH